MPNAIPLLVVWSLYVHVDHRRNDAVTDHWRHFDDREEADRFYATLLDHPQLLSAHIVVPVRSTDYSTVELGS